MKFSPKILTVSFAATLSIVACAFAQNVRNAQRSTIATPGQLTHAKLPDDVNDRVQYLIDRGLNYLKSQQKPDGGWQRETDPPGVTAIVPRCSSLTLCAKAQATIEKVAANERVRIFGENFMTAPGVSRRRCLPNSA